ncbi:uncharacterized protein TNCV_3928041 [Trichonephila clavipes]|nr:uncharacterized protein TNCV_3928041 [Trichonephila clavipes]
MGGINMQEDQNISHLMKGVAEDLYQVLINSEVSTVDKFVTRCREVDVMRKKRVVPLRYETQHLIAARQRRQLDQYERWDSDSVSNYGRDPESNYQRYRSNSPYPRRNPQRRQSRSVSRRSPVRTSEEN